MHDANDDVAIERVEQEQESRTPAEPAPPITSRFLYVDVAALRAKQLRRGARPRLSEEDGTHIPHKAERVAMEEVRKGLVQDDVRPSKGPGRPENENEA